MKANLVPIDKAGRVVLPKWVRERANLLPGDELKVSLDGQRIQLEPAVEESGVVRKGKALVFRSQSRQKVTTDLVERVRQERLATLTQSVKTKRK